MLTPAPLSSRRREIGVVNRRKLSRRLRLEAASSQRRRMSRCSIHSG
jgi:hypothetical protein